MIAVPIAAFMELLKAAMLPDGTPLMAALMEGSGGGAPPPPGPAPGPSSAGSPFAAG